MADQVEDFKIKGAASRPSSRGSDTIAPLKDEETPVQPECADDAESNEAVSAEADEVSGPAELEDGKITESIEELAKFRWIQSDTAPGSGVKYYYHSDTGASSWEPPDEPYLIWDCVAKQFDPRGLQAPPVKPTPEELEAEANSKTEEYTGYNPKIHGNYDPNADYAQYHNRKRAEEAAVAAAANPYEMPQAGASGTGLYESTMTLNRFTGNAQASGQDPDRHSDFAKSGRQMNAFFDVDAAANSHEGKSLKAERRSEKVTKNQVKKFNEAKQQKKRKKQMAFLLS